MFTVLQGWVSAVLTVVVFGLAVYALVDVLRRPAGVFTAAGKQSKTLWTVILGVATALSFISLQIPGVTYGGGLGLFAILSVVAAGVYLADVRPAVRQIRGGGGGHSGPYGPW